MRKKGSLTPVSQQASRSKGKQPGTASRKPKLLSQQAKQASTRDQMQALQRINQAISTTLDLNQVLQRIIAEVPALLGARNTSVMFYDEATQEVEAFTSYGLGSTLQPLRYSLAGSLTGWVAEHKRPLRVFRLTPEEWPTSWHLGEQLGAPPAHNSVLVVPLWVQGKVVGCLDAVWEPHHVISDHEESLLEAIAVQAAIAITNARLYQEKEQALQKAQESEERYRRLVELSPEAIAVHSQGKLVYVNTAGAKLLGAKSPEELLGKPVLDFAHPDYRQIAMERIRQTQEEGAAADLLEEKFVRLDGQVIDVEVAGLATVYEGNAATQVVVRDITARKQAEEALRESEEKYRDLVEHINDVIFMQNEYGVLTYISPVVEQRSGFRPEEIIGRPFTEFIHPDDLPDLLASFQRTLAGHLEPSEFRIATKSGEMRWVRSSSQPIKQGERTIGLRGVITDITDRKQAEARTVALLEVAKDISGTLDLHELLDRVQRRTATVLPCDIVATFLWDPVAEVFRLTAQYGIPSDLLSEAKELVFPPHEPFGGRLTKGQTVIINAITEQKWLPVDLLTRLHITALMAAPLRGRDRELGALIVCTTTDDRRFDNSQEDLLHGIARQLAVGLEATELYRRQQEEAAISSALARVGQELISSLDFAVLVNRLCQLTTTVLHCDASCTLLWQPKEEAYVSVAAWGYTAEEAERFRVMRFPRAAMSGLLTQLEKEEVVAVSMPASLDFPPEAFLRSLGARKILCVALRRGQELIGVQVCSYRAHDEHASLHLRIAQGIAQIASLVLANAKLLEELEYANRLKDDFVGTMSHELRTPLHIILGYHELLLEEAFGPLTAEQTDILQRINRRAKELLDLINATLDLSRLQNKQLPFALKEVCVTDVLSELESEIQQLPPKPALRVEWQRGPGLPLVYTDPIKLKVVLKNLITNALKFTDAGIVTIAASSQSGGVEFLVKDTGIGIAPEDLPHIFEPFHQLDHSTTRRYAGVGLGLYIVQQLLKLLDGEVSVESEVGKGSTFRVWIPQQIQNTK